MQGWTPTLVHQGPPLGGTRSCAPVGLRHTPGPAETIGIGKAVFVAEAGSRGSWDPGDLPLVFPAGARWGQFRVHYPRLRGRQDTAGQPTLAHRAARLSSQLSHQLEDVHPDLK